MQNTARSRFWLTVYKPVGAWIPYCIDTPAGGFDNCIDVWRLKNNINRHERPYVVAHTRDSKHSTLLMDLRATYRQTDKVNPLMSVTLAIP